MIGMLLACRVLSYRSLKGVAWAETLGEVVRLRRFWVLTLVSISINICWNFLINWLPTYLKGDRGMTYLATRFGVPCHSWRPTSGTSAEERVPGS